MPGKNCIGELLARRLSRRVLLAQSGQALVASSLWQAGCTSSAAAGLDFEPVAPSREDRVVVPADYASEVVLRWGDALFLDSASLDTASVPKGALLAAGAAAAQRRQFGYNCDGLATFTVGPDRLVICVNHEFPSPELLFPGWAEARRSRSRAAFVQAHPESVAVMQAALGQSVAELARDNGRWRLVVDSPLNRRVTTDTPIELSGPARGHALLGGETGGTRVNGTLGNCAAGPTPWRTYLSGEENSNDFFGNGLEARYGPLLERAYAGFAPRRGQSAYRWEAVDPRFDAALAPEESLKFGWIVELDPFDAGAPIKKRTALGRFKHEGATTTLAADRRAVVYMGDDEAGQHFYKFVSAEPFDAARPERNRDLLDHGTLYVARFGADGRGRWLPLVFSAQGELGPANGFDSQADVVIRCREAAARLGATALDRPEDVAVHPRDGRVYLACTQNAAADIERDAGSQAANPRTPNPYGHILEIEEEGDAVAESFRWEVLVLAGDPHAGGLRATLLSEEPLGSAQTYYAGIEDASGVAAFANPDNLGFDAAGNLWIVTDGVQPGQVNNGCFVCPTDGPKRGAVKQFMSGPVGAEICGCEMSADGSTLFLTVQHPGAGGSLEAPISHWPDGGTHVPRPSLVAIAARDGVRPVGA